MVHVINKAGKPLMPCNNVVARLLLKDNKARVKQTTPFTIKLNYELKNEYIGKLTLGIDTGSSTIGAGVVDEKGNVLYASEVEIRNDITSKMDRRRNYRKTRRNRKCRYRKCRFLNRKNSIKKGRLPPTMISKIDVHLREINFIKAILPISEVILEGGTFDTHALKNPEVLNNPSLYQKGLKYGFNNTKAFVLRRDNYTCQHCRGKSKDKHLHCHHIIFKTNGGSDEPENLIVLCKTCHDDLHDKKITLKLKGIKKRFIHATQMNVIRSQLFKRTQAIETFGYITKTHREALGLEKSHLNDAVVIASKGNTIEFNRIKKLHKKCIAKGDYQQTKGIRSQQAIPTGKIQGFRKFDKVKYNGLIYFIKGRMSSGYAILMDIKGIKQVLKPIPKFDKMIRIGARKSWIIIES